MTTQAEAPSLSWLALPAVTMVPSPRTGWSAARPSSVVSGRLPSSLASVTSLNEISPVSLSLMPILAVTGTISASKPALGLRGGGALLRLSSAYSSCASRPMP